MGINLSTPAPVAPDDIIAPGDRLAETILAIMWLGTAYAIGMIFTTIALVERWAGPHGERGYSFMGVLAALILSAAWPMILLFLAGTRNSK